MKNLAKLTLFFSLCFIAVFFASILLRLLASWVELTRIIPVGPEPIGDAVAIAWKALPVALYLTILLTLSYTARCKMPVALSIIGIIIMACIFTLGVSFGITRSGAMNLALRPVTPLQGEAGLILTQSNNSIVLLKDPGEIKGPRLVSIPGKPFIYQEIPAGPNNTILSLPALSLGYNTPWFIRSLDIDFSLSAGELKERFSDNLFSFGLYAFSIIFLLASLRFLLEFSQWPLANFFLGALVFRLILMLEIFLNSGEINALAGSFLTDRVPPMLVTPVVFAVLGVLILLYTLLVHIARVAGSAKRGENDE